MAGLEILRSGNSSSVCQHFARETTRGLHTVSSGGSPIEESPHTIIDVSSKRPRPGCVITPTGEKDHVVDEDGSVVSDDMLDMGEECDLRAATMPDVSLSEGVTVQQNPSQEGRRNSPVPYRCVCVCVFIKLHITAQPGPVKLIFQCYSNGSALWGICVCVCDPFSVVSCKCVQFHIVRIFPLVFVGCSVQCRR